MWRRSAAGFGDDARENEDSDQSISEEEEGLDGEWTRNSVSLGGGEGDKGKMQVLAQLEIFRESCELHSTKEPISSHGKKGDYHIKDEVETPIFNDGNSTSHYHAITSATLAHSKEGQIYLPHVASISYSDEEIISDDEKINPHTFRSAKENLAITWSEANREVEALVRSNENPCCSSDHHNVFLKEKKSTRGGGRRKPKAKFSFPCHSDKKNLSLVASDSNGGTSYVNIPAADEIGAVSDDEMDNYMAASQLNVRDKHMPPFEMSYKHDTREHSMADILNGFLEMSDLQEGSSELEIQKRSREQTVLERNVSPLGDSIQEDDDLPEALDTDTSVEIEDEWSCQENAHSIKSIISRTLADQFHEAFRTVSAIDDRAHVTFPRPLCGGLYRKLQQVIQIEKERVTDSLKNASAETAFKDEGMSILVRISSRSLEAKLIVCSCICVGDGKNLEMEMGGITRTMTIIFNPRMSSDVDLEVGSLIRMDPPWKEVLVKDEVIVLCPYFSQVQP